LVTKFIYNETQDTYTCPQGSILKTTGTWHKKTKARDSHQYKNTAHPIAKPAQYNTSVPAKPMDEEK